MRMARHLMGNAALGSGSRIARLMIEQHDRRARGPAIKRRAEVGAGMAMPGRGQVRHTGDDQMGGVPRDDCMGVCKHAHAQIRQMAHPVGIIEKIFMVAGDRENPVRGLQPLQRRDVGATHGHRAAASPQS